MSMPMPTYTCTYMSFGQSSIAGLPKTLCLSLPIPLIYIPLIYKLLPKMMQTQNHCANCNKPLWVVPGGEYSDTEYCTASKSRYDKGPKTTLLCDLCVYRNTTANATFAMPAIWRAAFYCIAMVLCLNEFGRGSTERLIEEVSNNPTAS